MTDPKGPKFQSALRRPRAFETIVYGGLAIGLLDLLFAFTFYGLIRGVPPLRIFQSVAAGILGRTAAYNGGVRTFVFGLALHFIVATSIAATYFAISSIWRALLDYPLISGLIYGMLAYLVMQNIVIPLSAIARRSWPPRLPILLTELIGHAVLVGLPVAFLARRTANFGSDRSALTVA